MLLIVVISVSDHEVLEVTEFQVQFHPHHHQQHNIGQQQSKGSSYAGNAELMRLTARPHAEAQNVMESHKYDGHDCNGFHDKSH